MSNSQTILQISKERLQELVSMIEADFGFDYSIDDGMKALVELRKLVGGNPDSNVKSHHDKEL